MYRLVLYYLLVLLAVAVGFSFVGLLPYSPYSVVLSVSFITLVSWLTNKIFASAFGVPANAESVYITALILALLILPAENFTDFYFYSTAVWASVWAQASKYIFAIRKKHLFNPAAFGLVLTALVLGQGAAWWVGTAALMPFVLVGGLLLVRKISRFDLAISAIGMATVTIVAFAIFKGTISFSIFTKIFLNSPLLFFVSVMVTEPLTAPPTRALRIIYGALTGFLFAPAIHVGSIYSTPELSLAVSNIFSYLVSPKEKLILVLKEKRKIAADMYDFVFSSDRKFSFVPGQYMEWTLGHRGIDSRGNRRFFTIASSPTEDGVHLGVKFYPESSSFKRKLLSLKYGSIVVASSRGGDFTLPKDGKRKLIFIAGGIGITPFRSMIKYLIDRGEKRDITLFYSNKKMDDIAYAEIFNDARNKIGLRTIYTLTDLEAVLPNWPGRRGVVDAKMIQNYAPLYRESIFYISGPHGMVTAFEKTLKLMGVPRSQIKKDYFPGFA